MAAADVVPPTPPGDDNKPLVSLAWQDVTVTATVLGLGNNQPAQAVYPKFDEKLPYRRGIKLPTNLAKLTKPAAKLPMRNPTNMQQQQRLQQQRQHQQQPSQVQNKNGGGGVKKCHICGRGFNKATYLKRHILSHSSVKPFKCNICGWGFFQYCNLKRHMTSHTISPGEGFKCSHCGASFSTKSVLSVHMRDAHGDKLPTGSAPKPKPANVPLPAEANFLSGSSAVSLLKVPKGSEKLSPKEGDDMAGKAYSCTLCEASFDKVSLLNKHIKMHNDAQNNQEAMQ